MFTYEQITKLLTIPKATNETDALQNEIVESMVVLLCSVYCYLQYILLSSVDQVIWDNSIVFSILLSSVYSYSTYKSFLS